ncbi:hypothetical protein A1122_08895 [Yersinia pestis A1122]|nr:hypothetical protein A1122_08895 [Yersinia pestis A1122]EKS44495.1 hypothetical protein INS_17610 [Yersinia pestis INS]ERP80363.1 hypothetical protein L327_16940 [Yersinia pestis S3]ERP80449.1 hypothetical protein L328_16880 [Yersinia pestis 24H]ERP81411.1 hypothetical protein L326_16785 [Yersinia pestis 113]ERP84964.1 hypothetical protein L325_16860 [Yersinia pestis 9]QOW15505.1 hypothetical protein S96127_3203 [Yersinia pestis]
MKRQQGKFTDRASIIDKWYKIGKTEWAFFAESLRPQDA